MEAEHTPVACQLSSPELRAREVTLFAEFKSGVFAVEELPDGSTFHFPGDEKCLAVLANLITAERSCCQLLRFALHSAQITARSLSSSPALRAQTSFSALFSFNPSINVLELFQIIFQPLAVQAPLSLYNFRALIKLRKFVVTFASHNRLCLHSIRLTRKTALS